MHLEGCRRHPPSPQLCTPCTSPPTLASSYSAGVCPPWLPPMYNPNPSRAFGHPSTVHVLCSLSLTHQGLQIPRMLLLCYLASTFMALCLLRKNYGDWGHEGREGCGPRGTLFQSDPVNLHSRAVWPCPGLVWHWPCTGLALRCYNVPMHVSADIFTPPHPHLFYLSLASPGPSSRRRRL